ncbi:hypothetical protein JK182_09600 [Acetobacter okinawensis]|uniref:hypothetical protein n=1 Tax=Acetobacter okinawensis TaxID=1076594 RepID=UPI001BA8D324|nr:hypothetical protein [Acetobacter okinawensis]MBS0988915.1 hypothetical protein [Acetobacter okinawensis]
MTDTKTTVTRRGEVYTFRLHWQVTQRQLKSARENPSGSINDLMAALTFSAFTLEAYTNFVSSRIFPDTWNQKRERQSSSKKIKDIFEKFELAYDAHDESTRNTIQYLTELRNELAHGKPYTKIEEFDSISVRSSRANFNKLQFKIPLYEKLIELGLEGTLSITEKVRLFANFVNSQLAKREPGLALPDEDVLSGPLSRAEYEWPELCS